MCNVFSTMSFRFYAISNRTGRMCNKNHISVKSKGLALFLCLFLADYSFQENWALSGGAAKLRRGFQHRGMGGSGARMAGKGGVSC